MSEKIRDTAHNLDLHDNLIEKMELPAPLYDWATTGARAIDGQSHGSHLPSLYIDNDGRLLNPYSPKQERGDEKQLRHEGPNRTNDIALLRQAADYSWQVLVIKRSRTNELALLFHHEPPPINR